MTNTSETVGYRGDLDWVTAEIAEIEEGFAAIRCLACGEVNEDVEGDISHQGRGWALVGFDIGRCEGCGVRLHAEYEHEGWTP